MGGGGEGVVVYGMGARRGVGAECCFVLNAVPSVVILRRDVRCNSVLERRVASKARLLVSSFYFPAEGTRYWLDGTDS